VTATLRTGALPDGVTASSLGIEHFDAGAGDWETLETAVVSEGSDRLVTRANTSGFSLLAVTVARDDQTTVGTLPGRKLPAARQRLRRRKRTPWVRRAQRVRSRVALRRSRADSTQFQSSSEWSSSPAS
jgi:hypothetical protein